MTKIHSWIEAFRLRTLPLAIASILMGSFLAIYYGVYSWMTIILAITTTLFLQILSNLANDYGDGIKGTDNVNRLGPKRAIQSGIISPVEMKFGIVIFVILSLISGIWLIVESLGNNWITSLIFLGIGILAIAAAIKYTIGKKAYGYSALGDIMVFLFFGPIAVMGVYFLLTGNLSLVYFLPAFSLGFLSTGVLNLNNIRDMKNDAESGKQTMALVFGFKKALIYHYALVILALLFAVIFTTLIYQYPWQFVYLITYPVFFIDLISISKIKNNQALDPYLKKLAITTLLFTLLFGFGLILG